MVGQLGPVRKKVLTDTFPCLTEFEGTVVGVETTGFLLSSIRRKRPNWSVTNQYILYVSSVVFVPMIICFQGVRKSQESQYQGPDIN